MNLWLHDCDVCLRGAFSSHIKKTWLWVVVLGVCLCFGCKAQTESVVSSTSYIIGKNDQEQLFRGSEQFKNYQPAINSTVLIVIKLDNKAKRYCSGFVIDKQDHYMKVFSNHHCFALKDESTDLAIDKLLDNACSRITVYFNVVAGMEEEISKYKAKCYEDSLVTNFQADMAAFVVTGVFPDNIQALAIEESEQVIGENAYIVHHPLGTEYVFVNKYKRLPAAMITESDCSIIGNYDSSQWEENPVLAVSYKHTCDLTKGSSGSPLVHRSSHKLLGLNWGGMKIVMNGEKDISNAAIKSWYILSFLRDHADFNYQIEELVAARGRSLDADAQPVSGGVSVTRGQSSSGCATLGHHSSGSSWNHNKRVPHLLWLIFLSPLLVFVRVRRS